MPGTQAAVALFASALFLPATLLAQKAETQAAQQLAAFYGDAAWRDFLAQDGGSWRVEWCPATGTPKAIWGSGVLLADWRENSLEEARRHAVNLLHERETMLRLGASEFREIIGSRMGRTWSFVFDQYFRGLPAIGGRADVRVNMSGRVAMFGSTAWQIPDDFDVTPRFDGDTALAMAWQALEQVPTGARQPARVAAPRLVIWGDVHAAEPASFFLAWEVAISNVDRNGNGPFGLYYIDAKTGTVLRYENGKHECGFAVCPHRLPVAAPMPVLTTVTVMAWTRTGNDGFSALVNVPLPGLQLSVPGIGAVTTDQNGQFQINISSAVSIPVGNLDGRHHAVIAGGSAPSGSFTVNPGVPATIQLLSSGATDDAAAHTTVSWWTDKTNEFCRSILGNSAQLATADNVVPTVNIADTCNAWYGGNTINFFSAGGGCSNTAFSTIVAHEWGHGLDDRYGGISQVDGLSEGWGDITGLYLVDSPILGSGFSTPGSGIRNGNNSTQYPNTGDVHTQGESWMGFAWKLRDRLATTLGNRPAAIALTNDIVIGTVVADATNQHDAVLEVFIADDNDGNLNNLTPHYADLAWACNQHSLPYPGAPSGVPNDLCADAIQLVNGINGPFTTVGATTSTPAWSCASGANDAWFTYSTAASGTLVVQTCGLAGWDTALQVFSGSCAGMTSLACNDDSCSSLRSYVSTPISAGTYYIRVGGYNGATGVYSLDVSGPGGVLASTATYGTGCYRLSKAFYELSASAAFDLGGSSMKLVRNGNYYVAQPGGPFVPPTGAAQQLSLTDDAVTIVQLNGTLAYPNGSTTSLEVCSNGFVSPATGNGNDWTPTAAEWVNSVVPRWGCWHDFNPNAAASGKVKFEKIGQIAYVTWDGVYSYNTTAANTWQMQFDLATGNVTFVWQTMVASGSVWLVGFAATTPNDDLGSIDISASLPGTFRTGPENMVPLALTGSVPYVGSTLTLTTTQFPSSSGIGVQVMSLVGYDPGIDLGSAGLPGCRLYANLDVLSVLLPNAGQAVNTWPVPTDPASLGLHITAQSAALVDGINAAGIIASNGVSMTVGF